MMVTMMLISGGFSQEAAWAIVDADVVYQLIRQPAREPRSSCRGYHEHGRRQCNSKRRFNQAARVIAPARTAQNKK